MALSGYLLDTSVMHRLAVPEVHDRVEELETQRPLYRCAVVDLEVLWSSTSPDNYESRRTALIGGFIDLPISSDIMTRALGTQRRLAEKSQHRGVSLADLVIAACAEAHDAAVVHYDADYDLIATITDQPTEWVMPTGSVN